MLFVVVLLAVIALYFYGSEEKSDQSKSTQPTPTQSASTQPAPEQPAPTQSDPTPPASTPPAPAQPASRPPNAPHLPAGNEVQVHFIDLGQADGILIRSAKNAVLIDGGEYKTRDILINYLKDAGITTLDYVVATHPHSDHIGGLAPVIRQFDVKEVIMPDATNNTRTFEHLLSAIEEKGLSITVPKVGDRISAGAIKLTVLAPAKDFKDLNNASIVIRLEHGKTSFIFTGDAETPSEREMIASGLPLRSDVLKAGHHGSRTSTSGDFLDAVRPSIVVVTCAIGNSYGHPHKEFLERINQPGRNIALIRTDEEGTIILASDGREIKRRTPDGEKSLSLTGSLIEFKVKELLQSFGLQTPKR